MSTEQYNPEFLSEMIEQLDASIRELERKERYISASLGALPDRNTHLTRSPASGTRSQHT